MARAYRRQRDRIVINTDNPEQEVWFRLSEHESEYITKKNMSRYYAEEGIRFSESELGQAASYFVYCLKQAKEYFRAAKNVSILTSPLLVFYGMVCLAKNLIILRQPQYPLKMKSDRRLRKHGLGYENRESDDALLVNDIVRIQDHGTFSSLCHFFKDDLPDQREYSIRELYGWVPELYIYGCGSEIQHCLASVNSGIAEEGGYIVAKIEVANSSFFSEQSLLDIYPFLRSDFTLDSNEGGFAFTGRIPENKKEVVKNIRNISEKQAKTYELVEEIEKYLSQFSSYDYFDREYLCPPKEKLVLNPLLATYMLMYGYSRVCRYHPQKWGRIIEAKSSNERWFVEKVLDLSFKTFPMEVHRIFVGKPVVASMI